MEIQRCKLNSDTSLPQYLYNIRDFKGEINIYSYDYAYRNLEGYKENLEDFVEKIIRLISIDSESIFYCCSFMMKNTDLNRIKPYDFRFKENNISVRDNQEVLLINNYIVKYCNLNLSGNNLNSIIKYMVDCYNERTFFIQPSTVLSEKIDLTKMIKFEKNRHDEISGFCYNMEYVYDFCKRNNCSLFFHTEDLILGALFFLNLSSVTAY